MSKPRLSSPHPTVTVGIVPTVSGDSTGVPKDRGSIIAYGLLFLAVLSVLGSNWRFSFTNGYFDTFGGVSTLGATRVLFGEMPYRDFWTSSAPGSFYVLATLFRIFGHELMVEVVAATMLCALAVVVYFSALRLVSGSLWLSLASAALFTAAMLNTGYYLRLDGYPPAVICTAIALRLMVRYCQSGRVNLMLWAGLLSGIAFVCKDDFGEYLSAAVVVALIAQGRLAKNRRTIRSIGTYVAGILAVAIPVILYFHVMAGADFWSAFVEYPARDHRLIAGKPLYNPFAFKVAGATMTDKVDSVFHYFKFALPFFAGLAGLGAITTAIRKHQITHAVLAVSLGCLFLIHFASSQIHMNQNSINMTAFASGNCVLWLSLRRGTTALRSRFLLMVAVSLLCVFWLVVLMGRPAYKIITRHFDREMTELALPRLSGFKVRPLEAEGYRDLLAFVNSHSAQSEAAYVGLARHDVMLVGELLLPVALGRPVPIRYHDLHPAIVTTERVQREMVASMEKARPSVVILKETFSDAVLDPVRAERRALLPDTGATVFDEYIQGHYSRSGQIGPYRLMLRK